jgi:hypothetical protein
LYLWLYLKKGILKRAGDGAAHTGNCLRQTLSLALNARSLSFLIRFAKFAVFITAGRLLRLRQKRKRRKKALNDKI